MFLLIYDILKSNTLVTFDDIVFNIKIEDILKYGLITEY